jgi:peptidylprolyl isomerase domain and WD repeat-containing protein 1
MAASDNPLFAESLESDPTLFATAYGKPRFYIFSTREPAGTSMTSRDIFNEKPSREEQTVAAASTTQAAQGTAATLHTSLGDIHLKLLPHAAPKAVRNFIALAKSGYYNGVTFHRVIKGFMCQTGDPNGDGTGGESSFGGEFEDEFHPAVRHDRPFMVSMANGGTTRSRHLTHLTSSDTWK